MLIPGRGVRKGARRDPAQEHKVSAENNKIVFKLTMAHQDVVGDRQKGDGAADSDGEPFVKIKHD
jgi:hypothetical protein